mgnify:CR=1 FL=1
MNKYKTPLELMTEWKNELQSQLTAEREQRKKELISIRSALSRQLSCGFSKNEVWELRNNIESNLQSLDTTQEKEGK